MNLTINGEKTALGAEKMTVIELLADRQVKMPEMVSVELNGRILKRQEFDTVLLEDGDEVEFLYFMGGGSLAERNANRKV